MPTNNYLRVTVMKSTAVYFFDDRDPVSTAEAEGKARSMGIYLKSINPASHHPAAINVYRRTSRLNYLEIGEMPERVESGPLTPNETL